MGGYGVITIDLNDEPKNIIIDIIDTGKGISTSEQKAIFNPGYTSKQRGWGLGLTFVKRIVEDYHGGQISASSAGLGSGTQITIRLPVPEA